MTNLIEKSFTAKIFVPGRKKPTLIPRAMLYKGKLVQLDEIVKNVFVIRPIFNARLMGLQGPTIRELMIKTGGILPVYADDVTEAWLLEYCFVVGQNPYNYSVEIE
jgi:hypothetical protein